MKKIVFSIIIPVHTKNKYLAQTLRRIKQQSFESYEVLLIDNRVSGTNNPAQKRNLGAKMAKGRYLAFLDDDSYPSPYWLKRASKLFTDNISAVCGPCLTPPDDNIYQQASGLIWSSWLGSGGAGNYRNSIGRRRFVDDFPSVNLIVKKNDFLKIGGFDTHHWPGEDTVLCLNLTQKLHRKILYHPRLVVYHHRRQVILPHLQQITRYALHRGFFAKKFPQTSLRIGYFIPSIFLIYLFFSPLFIWPLIAYLALLLSTFVLFLTTHNFFTSLLAAITIPITHIVYGFYFIIGLLSKNLAFKPRTD